MRIEHQRLHSFLQAIFHAAGCRTEESERIAHHLVESNLVGHDSHGAIRVPKYVDWLRAGLVVANQTPTIVSESEVLAIIDGQFGFGQVVGEEAMRIGLAKCATQGVAVVALRNSGHLGRIGDWAELAAREGKLSLHFVNTSGGGVLVAPFGGTQRRLSANPIAVGVPVRDGPPLVLDISTCTIAEGKIRVAFNKGERVPEGCILDGQGRPTTDPREFYATPPGAILPLGGHKGFGLGVIVEVLAGGLTGGGCTKPGVARVSNNMLTILIDPSRFQDDDAFASDIAGFIAFVKSSATVDPDGKILMPGEIEARTRRHRLKEGIELDEMTWRQLIEVGASLGIPDPTIAAPGGQP